MLERLVYPLAVAVAIAGCAAPSGHRSGPPTASITGEHCLGSWEPLALPGKRSTRYTPVKSDGRAVVSARADASASLLRERVSVAPRELGEISFSWKVPRLLPKADVRRRESEDAVARVVLGFAGDESRLSARNRAQFDLAALLMGERPPYATLMYVWDANAPVGTIVTNERSDRVRKIVVDGGESALDQWHDHRRDIVADFEAAFGEPPGALVSVALMTDADNTGGEAAAWYGPVCLMRPAVGER